MIKIFEYLTSYAVYPPSPQYIIALKNQISIQVLIIRTIQIHPLWSLNIWQSIPRGSWYPPKIAPYRILNLDEFLSESFLRNLVMGWMDHGLPHFSVVNSLEKIFQNVHSILFEKMQFIRSPARLGESIGPVEQIYINYQTSPSR